jgi:site-specific recombinase XerD
VKNSMVLANFLEMLRVRHFSAATVDNRRKAIGDLFAWLETSGVADLREVSRDTIADYQRARLRGHAVGTVCAYVGSVRQLFAHLENTGAILLNPTLAVPLPKAERRLPRRLLQPSEVRKLLSAPDGTPKGRRDQAMLELFYSSGIRREEMARLTVPDVDIRHGLVRVRGKGGQERVVPIGQTAGKALGKYLKEARSVWLKARRNPGWTDALWLSPIQPHPPLKKEAIAAIVRRHARQVLGRNVSPHVWRHSYATHLVSNGANIVYVQRLLGHKSLKTTEIYTRVSVPDLKKTLQRAHPGARRTATPPGLSREAAADMHIGHKQAHP